MCWRRRLPAHGASLCSEQYASLESDAALFTQARRPALHTPPRAAEYCLSGTGRRNIGSTLTPFVPGAALLRFGNGFPRQGASWRRESRGGAAPFISARRGGGNGSLRVPVSGQGGERLESPIDELGLRPPLTRRRGLGRRCGQIAMSGLLLRFGQTDLLEDRRFEESQSTNKIRIWPFEATTG